MYLLDSLLSIYNMNILNFILLLICTYPHFILIKEIKSGIMSKDNYDIYEKHSYCCV